LFNITYAAAITESISLHFSIKILQAVYQLSKEERVLCNFLPCSVKEEDHL
jgi:hypothetical protein